MWQLPALLNKFLDMVGRDEDIQVGDLVITSGIAEIREGGLEGLGDRTLRGFPVGVVSQVSSPSDMIFKEIVVQPSAEFEFNETVFVVVPFGSDSGMKNPGVEAP